jgi:uncharacterized protein YcaQ
MPRLTLSLPEARARLVSWLGLAAPLGDDPEAVAATLRRLRCVQMDPLDPIGTNHELVLMARVDAVPRSALLDALLPGEAFEHFAKERCLLPAAAWPLYRSGGEDPGRQPPWWREGDRLARLSPNVMDVVYAEIAARGPLTARALPDLGAVDPIDWSGWKGTAKAATLALELLWRRCRVVVSGRSGRDKLYDLPERALAPWHRAAVPERPLHELLRQRVEAAGLLQRRAGPTWSSLGPVQQNGVLDAVLDEGLVVEVGVEGLARPLLCPPALLEAPVGAPDGRVRVLGPLDPLLWDRALVAHLFDFEYLWEVYKPAAQRRWGWYVHPLLQGEALIGRVEARIDGGRLVVARLWREAEGFEDDAVHAALSEHARRLGLEGPGPLPPSA